MTDEEQKIFKDKILEVIMPIATNMTEKQIKEIIEQVDKDNKDLPTGFASMLHEQILYFKYSNMNS